VRNLVVGSMSNSIHTATWLAQLEGAGWEVHLFPPLELSLHAAICISVWLAAESVFGLHESVDSSYPLPEDPCRVAEAILKAIADDALVDNAARESWKAVEARLSSVDVREQALAAYRRVMGSAK